MTDIHSGASLVRVLIDALWHERTASGLWLDRYSAPGVHVLLPREQAWSWRAEIEDAGSEVIIVNTYCSFTVTNPEDYIWAPYVHRREVKR